MHVCYRCGAHAGATAYAHVAPKYMENAWEMLGKYALTLVPQRTRTWHRNTMGTTMKMRGQYILVYHVMSHSG